jgi:hypothetical protein
MLEQARRHTAPHDSVNAPLPASPGSGILVLVTRSARKWPEPGCSSCGGLGSWVARHLQGRTTVDSFGVRVFATRRRPGRKTFEVRSRVAGRDRSRPFMPWALADSYHAELVRAARNGLAFDLATGEPAA